MPRELVTEKDVTFKKRRLSVHRSTLTRGAPIAGMHLLS